MTRAGAIHDIHGPGLSCWCGYGQKRERGYILAVVPWKPDRSWHCPACGDAFIAPDGPDLMFCGCTRPATYMVRGGLEL